MKNNNSFIINTAKDYDMSFERVEKVYNNHCDCKGEVRYEDYYEELERIIRQRSKQEFK